MSRAWKFSVVLFMQLFAQTEAAAGGMVPNVAFTPAQGSAGPAGPVGVSDASTRGASQIVIAQAGVGRLTAQAAPSITLTWPPDNAVIAEDLTPSVLLQAAVSSTDYPVAHVVFYVCETRAGTCIDPLEVVADIASPPYEFRWIPRPYPTQSSLMRTFQTRAMAVNSAAQAQISSPVSFTLLQPPPPPSVNLIVPKLESGYMTPASPVLYATAEAGGTLPPSTIVRVDFLDGSAVIGSVTTPNSVPTGYAFVWQNAPHGMHLVAARAVDSLGYSATSAQVTVYIVDPDPPPQVALTSPMTGQTFASPNSVPLAATATSAAGTIQRVEFVTKDLVIGTVLSPPFVTNWVNPPPGNFAVVAKAYDDIGVASASAAAYIQVLPTARAPSIVITAPIPGASTVSGASLTITATTLAPDGEIGRVDYYSRNTLLGASTTPPYSFVWPNAASGPQSIWARAVTVQGQSSLSASVPIQVSGNRPPTVSIVTPVDGSQFAAPATIALAATAADVDGTVMRVEYFAHGAMIAAGTAPSFATTWSNVGAGNHSLTAVAIDNLGTTTTSAAVAVTVSAPPPTVSLTAPRDGATYASGQSIVLSAAASAPQRSISRVEFYNNGILISSTQVNGGPSATNVNLTWNSATSGSHVLTAKVFTIDGASVTSASVNITVSDLAVNLTEPYAGQVYQGPGQIRITANPSESGGSIARADFYGDGVLLGSRTSAPYDALWSPVATGAHNVKVLVRDEAGLTADSGAVGVIVVAVPTLQADSGIDGASVADDNASISGYVQAPENSAVTVNGQSAALDQDGHFFANSLQLAPGANTVTFVLNTLDGTSITRTVTLNSTGIAPFAVTLDKQEGLAPFTTNVTITNRGNVAFQRIELDLNDDGTPEQAPADLSNGSVVKALTYTNPGVYTLRVTVYDASNTQIYQAKRKIRVYAPVELGLKVVNVYKNMVNHLIANNPTAALRYFTGDAQDQYAGVFTTLGNSLPAVAAQLGTLVDGVAAETFTELTLVRDTLNGRQAFVVHLIRGADGIWRIESM